MKNVLMGLLITCFVIACNKSGQDNSSTKKEELANQYFSKAKEYFNSRDYKTTVMLLDSALIYQPDHLSSVATRASALFNIDEFDKALADYNYAIERWPTDEENKATLASLYLERGDTFYALKEFDKAIADFTASISIDPANDLAYVYRGDARDYAGLHQEAMDDYTKAIELNPTNGDAFYNRGVTKQNMNDQKGACEDFKKAVELGNQDAETYAAACK